MSFEEIEYDYFTEIRNPHSNFKSYEIIIARWKDKERTDIDIKHREVVVASCKSAIKEYMKMFAGNKVAGKKKWKWDGDIYEQKGGKYYVSYEKLDLEPVKKILL